MKGLSTTQLLFHTHGIETGTCKTFTLNSKQMTKESKQMRGKYSTQKFGSRRNARDAMHRAAGLWTHTQISHTRNYVHTETKKNTGYKHTKQEGGGGGDLYNAIGKPMGMDGIMQFRITACGTIPTTCSTLADCQPIKISWQNQ